MIYFYPFPIDNPNDGSLVLWMTNTRKVLFSVKPPITSQELRETIKEETEDDVEIEKGTTIEASCRCNRSNVNAIQMYLTNGKLYSATVQLLCYAEDFNLTGSEMKVVFAHSPNSADLIKFLWSIESFE